MKSPCGGRCTAFAAVVAVTVAATPGAALAQDPAPAPQPAPTTAPQPPPTTAPQPAPTPTPQPAPTPTPQPAPTPAAEPAEGQGRDAMPVRPTPPRRDIVIEVPGERTSRNKLAIGGVAIGGVLVGAIGVYYNLESRDAANEASAKTFTNKAWTPEKMERIQDARDAGRNATIAYSIGGALVVGAIAAFIITAPKSETTVIRTGGISPTDGGAVVHGTWSF